MSAVYGGFVTQPAKWSANVKLGGVNTPPIEFVLDDTLPALGQDPNYPNRDWLVIPHGRIVAGKATDLTRLYGTTVLTVANGVDPKDAPSFATGCVPFGYAPYNIYRNFPGLPADKPLGVKHETIEVPYTSINESYNTSSNGGTRLKVGEWLMPYYGSTNRKTSITPKDKGKLVRFVERRTFLTTVSSASANVLLDSAPFPAFKPKVLLAYTAAGAVDLTGTVSLTYNETYSKWEAVFGQAIKHVVYEYGAEDAQRIGQCIGIEPVGTAGGVNGSSHEMAGWLKWVTDNFGAWDWPPMVNVKNTTSVTAESVTISSNTGTLANTRVVPFKTISVKISGSVVDADGTSTSYDGTTELPLADEMYFNDFTQGRDYDIDFLTGVITFRSNVTVYSCTVSYYYEADFDDGLKWDAGILGLTDGSGGSGITGLPAHLDISGVMGAMRVMIL